MWKSWIILPIDELHHFSRWLKHVLENHQAVVVQGHPRKCRLLDPWLDPWDTKALDWLDSDLDTARKSSKAAGKFKKAVAVASCQVPGQWRQFHGWHMDDTWMTHENSTIFWGIANLLFTACCEMLFGGRRAGFKVNVTPTVTNVPSGQDQETCISWHYDDIICGKKIVLICTNIY